MSSFSVKRAGSTLDISLTLITVYGKVSEVYTYDTG